MIVEDQDMPGCFAPYGDGPRHNREESLLLSRCSIRQSDGSIRHHLFLTISRDNVSGFYRAGHAAPATEEMSCNRNFHCRRPDAASTPPCHPAISVTSLGRTGDRVGGGAARQLVGLVVNLFIISLLSGNNGYESYGNVTQGS